MSADGECDALRIGGIAIEDADLGAGLREPPADRFADALAAAGDEGDFAVETKEGFHLGFLRRLSAPERQRGSANLAGARARNYHDPVQWIL